MAPNHLQVDREAMEREFWQAAELEGVADIEEINRVLDRAVTLKNMLKSEDRVEAVARFVAQHFQAYVQPMGYKAFLVAVDREACCLYKEALDRHLPPEVSQVVISPGHNDPPAVKRYHLSEEQEAAVRKAFRKPDENPQILIVTEKLLTGYDAPSSTPCTWTSPCATTCSCRPSPGSTAPMKTRRGDARRAASSWTSWASLTTWSALWPLTPKTWKGWWKTWRCSKGALRT